jgi:pyruvate kinase
MKDEEVFAEGLGLRQRHQDDPSQPIRFEYRDTSDRGDDVLFTRLIPRLNEIQRNMDASWLRLRGQLKDIQPANRESARNLVHYLALRRHDVRDLQKQLAQNGISSLGRSESHVMSNLNKVQKLLHGTLNLPFPVADGRDDLSLDIGTQHLNRQTTELFGAAHKHRKVRIMVTLPSEASDDYDLVRDLIEAGMDCARINCAHDGPEAWKRMVDNVHAANQETGRHCKISIDLAGPKLRTGELEPGPEVIKWRPVRNSLGRVVKPASIWVTSVENPSPSRDGSAPTLLFPKSFIDLFKTGDKLKFIDARGAHRHVSVLARIDGGLWLEAKKTAYVTPDTRFSISDKRNPPGLVTALPRGIPAIDQFAILHSGDTLILTRSQAPGKLGVFDSKGKTLVPARIPCTLPQVFDDVKVGESIWFDDGKLGGVILSVDKDEVKVEITKAGPSGHRLKADKGINLPKTKTRLPSLTDKDIKDLEFIVKNADMVGFSFVRTGDDVRQLQKLLRRMGGEDLGIVLKIETRAAFDNLAEILLAAMESPVVGVMIARGDLAVEAGFKRMAEVQEEILWMCEAAHMPVIWATQVLEQLSKKGVYSRAEITDAAMSERAECVMLNKGPYILEAVRTLDDVLSRMEAHQQKKRSMMRPLKLAERFFAKHEAENNWRQTLLF